jgi:hypothetical protein
MKLGDSRLGSSDGRSARRKAPAYTGQHNADIHASSGNRTHDPSVWDGEDISCTWPRGHCDWLISPTGV